MKCTYLTCFCVSTLICGIIHLAVAYHNQNNAKDLDRETSQKIRFEPVSEITGEIRKIQLEFMQETEQGLNDEENPRPDIENKGPENESELLEEDAEDRVAYHFYENNEDSDSPNIFKSLGKSVCMRNIEENQKFPEESWKKEKYFPNKKSNCEMDSKPRILKNEKFKFKNAYQKIKNSNLPIVQIKKEMKSLYPNLDDIVKPNLQGKEKADLQNEVEEDFDKAAMPLPVVKGRKEKEPNPFFKKLTLPDCTSQIYKRSAILLVSTLDGHLSGIDYNSGEVLWSHQIGISSGPLLSSTISKVEISSRGEWVRLIPSLDGGIYSFDGENVEPLPVNADSLLHSSFKFNEDTIFTGGKLSEVIGLSPSTGEIKYVCDFNGCPQSPSASLSDDVLVIKRVTQTVRAIDPRTGSERWNFSVGQHDLNYSHSDCEALVRDNIKVSRPALRFVLPQGVVIGLNAEHNNMIWKQQLASPIVAAWTLDSDELEKIDLFSSSSVPALVNSEEEEAAAKQPSIYVGIHEKQLYIQQNSKFHQKIQSVLTQHINGHQSPFPIVQWKPYLASALSRTPVIHHNSNKNPLQLDFRSKEHTTDLIIKHSVDYPFDNGYYLYGDDAPFFNESDYWSSRGEPDKDYDEFITQDSYADQMYYYCFQLGPNLWWQAMCAIGGYFLVHFLFFRYAYRRVKQNIQRAMEQRAIGFIRENRHNWPLLNRLRLNLLAALPPAEEGKEQIVKEEKVEVGNSQESKSGESSTQRQDSSYSSRYTTDFEPLSCLGKGGFGVVFHVKNNLDENEYAIKRIVLPSKESSAERVKREVRALAKLNHTNIVRYYNSWLETPPPGWELDADAWWKSGEAVSSSLLSPYPEESEYVKSSNLGEGNAAIANCNKESLSGVINKMTQGTVETYLFNKMQEGGTTNTPGSDSVWSNSEENPQDSVSSSSEEESMEKEEGETDDSSDDSVAFENNEEDDSVEFKDNSVEFKDDSIVFEDKNSPPKLNSPKSSYNSPLDNIEDDVVRNRFNGLTCKTLPATKQEFDQKRSLSLDVSKKPEIVENKRKRTQSQRFATKGDRPKTLNLISSSSDPGSKSPAVHATSNLIKKIVENPRTYMYIQMELCLKESLKDWLFSNMQRDKLEVNSFFNDIVSAVEYVHDQSLMHRDLKPSNIFFSLDGEIKIGDFGLVTTIDEGSSSALTPLDGNIFKKMDTTKQRTLNAGTHLYMSPEQMMGLAYNYKVDIFSLGLILFEMLEPFSTEMERRTVMLQARDLQFPASFQDNFPDEFELLQMTLHKDPKQRLTTRGIRSRKPLVEYQRDLHSIKPEEHFNLSKTRGHSRSHSGSLTASSISTS